MSAAPPSPAFTAAHEILEIFWTGMRDLREGTFGGDEGLRQHHARTLYFSALKNRALIGELTLTDGEHAALLRCYADLEGVLLQYL